METVSLFPSHPDELGEDFDDVREMLVLAQTYFDMLTDWESNFVDDMMEKIERFGYRTRVSEKQMEIIERIHAKVNE